ncbi:dihydrodipicolinate synthase family protein [Yinghuangia aomiensis]
MVLSVGVGTNDTRKAAAELAALGRVGGVAREAALVTVPYFTRPSEDGVVAHFAELAAASPVPLIVYHVPYRTGRPLSAATLRRLAALPGVAGDQARGRRTGRGHDGPAVRAAGGVRGARR